MITVMYPTSGGLSDRLIKCAGTPASDLIAAAARAPAQTTHWLTWLARQLKQQDQTVFYLEHLQPEWLAGGRMRQAYDRWAVRFPAILMGILASLAIGTVLFSLTAPETSHPSYLAPFLAPSIVLGGFFGWLLGTGRTTQQLHQSSGKARRGSWSRLVGWLMAGGLIGPLVGLSSGLFFGLTVGLTVFRSSSVLSSVLIGGLIGGLSAGLLAGLLNGGLACLRHSVVRLLLWRAGSIPWNYPRFLDDAAEHILLRKVGGSYIFVHRLLLEYFASLDSTPPLDEARAQSQQAQPVP